MHAVHNARIQLLATAQNNVALAFIVAGFVAPAVTVQLAYVTWDQVVTWLIVPAIVAIVIRAADAESLRAFSPTPPATPALSAAPGRHAPLGCQLGLKNSFARM